jgi:shikimate kinase
MRNIVLIGFMGTGKTTIATKVARMLKMRYVSTDDLIEKREKSTISEIFRNKGEGYFRNVEAAVVKEVSVMDEVVIDAGGGVVLRDENMENLRSSGVVINLTADEEHLIARTKKYRHRPLLNVDDPKRKIRELLAKRAPLYAKADQTIDTGKLTIDQVVKKVAEIFAKETRTKE